MENLPESNSINRCSFINTLFWGLLIIFINIKIENFDISNDILGLLIVIYGLYKLRNVSKMFSKALIFSLFSLVLQIFCTIFYFSIYSVEPVYYISSLLIGLVISACMTYFILSGLAEIAANQKLDKISSRLKGVIPVYLISLFLSALTIFLAEIAIVFLFVCFLLYVFILSQIRSAYKNIDDTFSDQTSVKGRFLKTITLALIVCLLPSALGVGIIAFSENISVETTQYNKNDVSIELKLISETRKRIIDLGVESYVVEDMPDSEIYIYKNVEKVQKCGEEEFDCDGGKLRVIQYVSRLDSEENRYMAYYKWLKSPTLAHAEAIGIMLFNKQQQDLVFMNQSKFSSVNLYDIENGNKTYISKDVEVNEGLQNSVKKFKLPNDKQADNYRGYLAFNAKTSQADWSFTNVFYYIHQSTIFNNKGKDIINFNDEKQSFSLNNENFMFKEYNVVTNVDSFY